MPRKKVEKPAPVQLVPIRKAADRLGCHVDTLRERADSGKIASHKMPGRCGRVYISEAEIERIIAETYRPRIER
jgi:excisionase family DNA binding protein